MSDSKTHQLTAIWRVSNGCKKFNMQEPTLRAESCKGFHSFMAWTNVADSENALAYYSLE